MASTGDFKDSARAGQICNICIDSGDKKDGQYYCKQCLEYLCAECKEAHRRVRVTRDHKIRQAIATSTDSLMITSDVIYECEPCKTDGVEKEATYFCDTCKEHMCNTCENYHQKFKAFKDHRCVDLCGITRMKSIDISNLTSQTSGKLNIKFPNDANTAGITGCTVLSNGYFLLCDEKNSCIKLLDNLLVPSDRLDIGYKPWDVAVVDDRTAIVTLPNSNQLLYLELVPKLYGGSKVSTKMKCFGITVARKRIYVTCHDGPKVLGGDIRVLDLQGNELKRIGINRDGSQYLEMPFRIESNRDGNKLFVSNCGTGEILCITTSNDIVYRWKDDTIISPYGLYVDDVENLLFCDRNNSTVQVIAANGTKHKTLLVSTDGIKNPICVGFRPADLTLIFGVQKSNDISVFKLA